MNLADFIIVKIKLKNICVNKIPLCSFFLWKTKKKQKNSKAVLKTVIRCKSKKKKFFHKFSWESSHIQYIVNIVYNFSNKIYINIKKLQKNKLVEATFILRRNLSMLYKKSCYAKRCSTLSLFCSCDQNPWKISAKEFFNSRVAAFNLTVCNLN